MTEKLDKKTPLLSRREFIGNTVKLAVAGALIPGALSQLLPAVAPDALGGVGPGPVVRRDATTNAKIPISVGDLNGTPPVVLTAEWNFLPAVIYKVKKSTLVGSSAKREYNTAQYAVQHPTEPDNMIMVYDGKCKHLGCTVGWNAGLGSDYDEDGFNDGHILCPCHQGEYDIYNLALNQPGTPPPAPLNVIEFDIKPADGDLGVSVSDAIFGVQKVFQNGPQEAAGAGDYPSTDAEGEPFQLNTFAARVAGWST